jgi:soluble lytic murein transglycosylase
MSTQLVRNVGLGATPRLAGIFARTACAGLALLGAAAALCGTTHYVQSASAMVIDRPPGLASDTWEQDVAVPVPLSDKDIGLYKRIFALQEKAQWTAADRLIKQIDNPLLMGQVQYQRFMHPSGYRSSYHELAEWLKDYADEPGAARVYKLALKRKPAGARAPNRPVAANAIRAALRDIDDSDDSSSSHSYSGHAAHIHYLVARDLRRGSPDRAEKQLVAAEKTHSLSDEDLADEYAEVAEGYFFKVDDAKALALADHATDLAPGQVIDADWIGGLAAWRSGKYEEAADHFEAITTSNDASQWMMSAGAFWAARANLVIRRPERVNPLLSIAAAYPRTFYGLIATRQLVQDISFAWDKPPLGQTQLDQIVNLEGVRRTIALVAVGQTSLAEQELRLAWGRSDPALGPALLGLATKLDLPSSQIALSDDIAQLIGVAYDSALYPMPNWQPEDGYGVDRALIFALIRQESRFNANAKSSVGARGLMQLMPSTASWIAQDRTLRWRNNTKLYTPDLNLEIGQKYVHHLMELDFPGDNLLLLPVAYNAGPGNLQRWLRRYAHDDDWLLFIESIPVSETRNYVERVLSNFWIYRSRLGQPTPSLDALAQGDTPRYVEVDGDKSYTSAQATDANLVPVNAKY